MKLKIVLLSLVLTLLFSCEKCNVYYVNSDKTVFKSIATIEYSGADYLNLALTINRNDSLFVKNIKIIPLSEKENFPKLNKFKMTSILRKEDYNKPRTSYNNIIYKEITPGNKVRIDDFYADYFTLLPKYNRFTNIGPYHITYNTIFKSDKQIKLESFKVLIIAELIDTSGKLTIEKETLTFNRKEYCWTSYAFH